MSRALAAVGELDHDLVPVALELASSQLFLGNMLLLTGRETEAVVVLERALARCDVIGADAEEVTIQLLALIADYYADVQLYDRALPLLDRAAAIGGGNPVKFAREMVAVLQVQGTIFKRKGDYTKALAVSQHVVKKIKDDLGAPPRALIESVTEVGGIYSLLHDYRAAMRLFLEASSLINTHAASITDRC